MLSARPQRSTEADSMTVPLPPHLERHQKSCNYCHSFSTAEQVDWVSQPYKQPHAFGTAHFNTQVHELEAFQHFMTRLKHE